MLVRNTSTYCATFTTISWYSLKTVMIHRFTSFIKWQANEYHLVHVNYTSYRIHELQEIMLRSVNHLPRFIARSNVIIRNIDFSLRRINLIFTFPLFFQRFPSQTQYLKQKSGRYFHVNFSPGQEKVQCGTDTNVKNFKYKFPISILSFYRIYVIYQLWIILISYMFFFTELSRDRSLLRCCGCGRGWCRIESRLWFR